MDKVQQNQTKLSRTISQEPNKCIPMADNRISILKQTELIKSIQNSERMDCLQRYKKGKRRNRAVVNIYQYPTIGEMLKTPEEKIKFYGLLKGSGKIAKYSSLEKDYYIDNSVKPCDKKEYYENITPNCKGNDQYWIPWPYYATGDLTSMATALIMGFKHGIRLSTDRIKADYRKEVDNSLKESEKQLKELLDKNDPESLSKKDEITQFITILKDKKKALEKQKEHYLKTKNTVQDNLACWLGGVCDEDFIITDLGWKADCSIIDESGLIVKQTDQKTKAGKMKFSWLTRVVAEGRYGDESSEPDEIVEGRKGIGLTAEDQKKVRRSWLGEGFDSPNDFPTEVAIQINNWLTKYLGEKAQAFDEAITNKKVCVIWIRKSGEGGGAHYENDTSFNAIKKRILKNKDHVNTFILAGDKKGEKTEKITSECPNTYDFTQFWKSESDEIRTWEGKSRTKQLRLYEYIKHKASKLDHQGSMSGGLEALAILGHQVHFKAKNREIGVERMERYKGNELIHYDRIDFQPMRVDYNYSGFEKSAAKYYVFFSSGIIQHNPSRKELYRLYKEQYDPHKNYKVKDGGLNGENAENARIVSKELAKREKLQRRLQLRTEANRKLKKKKKKKRDLKTMAREMY